MIPRIAEITPTQAQYLAFIETLRARGFRGSDINSYKFKFIFITGQSNRIDLRGKPYPTLHIVLMQHLGQLI